MRILLQFRWKDVRLAFDNLAPMDSSEVVCQKGILERIWLPKVYIANEKHSLTVADMTEDLMVTVLPDGTVMLSVRCGSHSWVLDNLLLLNNYVITALRL